MLACVFGCAAANAQMGAFDVKISPVQGRGRSAIAGDFNKDGKLDLAMLVSDGGNTTLQVFLGAGDATFRLIQTLPVPAFALALAAGDLNGDGQIDLVLQSVQVDASTFAEIPQLTLYLGLPDGTFRVSGNPIPLPVFSILRGGPGPLNIGDVNGDGNADIVMGPHYADDTVPDHSEITVLPGNGDGTFAPAIETLTDLSVYLQGLGGATLADVTDDGRADLIATYVYRGGNVGGLDVYNGQSDGTMQRSYTVVTPGMGGCSDTTPVTGDFNGDGWLDFAANLCLGFQITLQGFGHFVPAGVSPSTDVSTDPIAGDLDGDGNLDLVFARNDELVFLRGDGHGGFIQPGAADPSPSLYAGAAPAPVKIADVNGDGKPDLIVLTNQGIAVLLSNPLAPAPQASAAGVVNAASELAGPLTPGSIVTIYGTNLAVATGSPGGQSFGFGTQVSINLVSMPLLYVSASQINAQIPPALAGVKQATLNITRNGKAAAPIPIQLADYSPALFTMGFGGSGQGAILIDAPAYQTFLAAPVGQYPGSRPARRGETVWLYGTGLGPLTGEFAATHTVATPVVTFGGVLATVTLSGLANGLLGVNQVSVTVPPNAPAGDAIPVVLAIGGVVSNTVTIALQ